MFLSRIELDVTRSKTRKALSSPQMIHAALEGCFPGEKVEDKPRKLWRIDSLDERLYLLILSPEVPDFKEFALQFSPENGETRDYKPFLSRIREGQRFRFRFRGNPVHSIKEDKSEQGKRGKIYPHITIVQKRLWLSKKSESCGFMLQEGQFDVVETGNLKFLRKTSQLRDGEASFTQKSVASNVEIAYSVFEGQLTVTDGDKFKQALTQGIGRAKAYGCGLLTVMSVK